MLKENHKQAIYSIELDFQKSPEDVFQHLIDLKSWWPENFAGDDLKLDSVFELTTGSDHYSRGKVIEFAPAKKFVWVTTEAQRTTDGYDWTGTEFIFELTPKYGGTHLKFTYDGIVMNNESDRLVQICDITVKEMFFNFLVNGKSKDAVTNNHDTSKSYTAAIEVINSPQEIFEHITIGVAKWWGGKDLSGSSVNLNDEFIVDHPGAHYSKQKLVEVMPGKKLVWHVTESSLSWLKEREEWKNTYMIFEIIEKQHSNILQFTHSGLTPDKESYEKCSQGWNMVIKDWLYTFIMYNKPHFN